AVIAIENARLFEAEQASKRELQESLEYQTATSEVLSVISRSPNDLQPVLDTISATAGKLCEADDAHVLMLQEGKFHLVAHNQSDPKVVAWFRANPFGMEDPGSVSARAARQQRSVHVHDVREDPDFGVGGPITFSNGRSVLSVPLLRAGTVVGVVTVSRRTVRPFTDKQIELLTTFADQAVIAIENTRLFEAEQAGKRELQESLEYQTATSDVLRVISNSPTDIKPVLRAICETASRICEAQDATVFLRDGGQLKFGAHHGSIPNVDNLPISRDLVTGRAVLDRRPVHVHDLADAVREFPLAHEMARRMGHRTILTVPLMREDVAIGVIGIRRTEVKPFTDRQIDLLKTFADQAVIAIENTRLFEEVQARNRALAEANTQLTETLEQQTATSRILRVISRSPTDVQPVFETTVESAARLCDADRALIYRFDGEFLRLAASSTQSRVSREFIEGNPFPPGRQSTSGRAALERQTVHILDVQADAEYAYGARRVDPIRSTLAVPMLKGDGLLGVVTIY